MKKLFPLSLAIALLAPVSAFAHPGHGGFSFLSGLQHPVGGPDHLMAMLAVGLLGALKGGRALWLWPACFVGFMIVGALVGLEGFVLPFLEPVIALSVLVLGLAIVLRSDVAVGMGAVVIAAFALFHGNVHGAEAPMGAALSYIAGFTLATAFLHGTGLAFGLFLHAPKQQTLVRVSGTAMAVFGAILLIS